MKNFKIISILVCVITIISAIAITSNAKFWDDNPFTDVKSTHWYYDAVRICNENDIFNGTAEDKYSPSVKMTRAMLVKALANLDGYTEDFKGTTPFTDVKANHWFASAVEWAYNNKITSGKTDTTFAPNENITREQLAAMLHRYAVYKGVEDSNTADIASFPDAAKVSSYAVKDFEWAYGNGIINGSASNGKTYLNPRNPATRAECATMFSKYLYLEPVYEINDNDLRLYTVVYSATEVDSVKKAAEDLAKYIEQSIGIALPVVTDDNAATDYEILVGKTNRENPDDVTYDRNALGSDTEYVIVMQGNKLLITGTDDSTKLNTATDRSHHNIKGTLNAVYHFLETKFGYDFYYDGDGIVTTPDPVIAIDSAYCEIDFQGFESVDMYIDSEGSSCYNNTTYYSEWGCGVPHQLVNLINGGWKSGYGTPTVDNICYSDPANIEKALINTRELLEANPTLNLVGLIQTDSDQYCRCSSCAAVYREHGRAGTIIQLVNYVAENLEEDYPDVCYASMAYNWSSTPPKSDLKYHDNVILYHAPITLCPAHEYTDTTCKYNKGYTENIASWQGRAGKFYLWDYTGSFGDCMTPCPDLDSIASNVRAFYNSGVRGVFLNGRMGNTSDMYGLRAYLFTQLYRDPTMSDEEYSYRMNGFLKTFYGDGYTYIRQYIDKLGDIADQQCTGTHVEIDKTYNLKLVYPVSAELDALWDKAEAAAKTEDQLYEIQKYRLSWTYLMQCARYENDYVNGDEATRAQYLAVNEKLSNDIVKFNVKWDGKGDAPSGEIENPPNQW
ncbi:MAG: DUF4838 domain-containing protein [Clostridia bacterium]|nr:DUF4838 domain-containing protein [Clostridia bacterium]